MAETPVFCVNHPNRETALRCNRCGDPICAQCAVLTPVGYRCKKCIRLQQRIFETARWHDFPVAFFVSALICGAGSILSSYIGFLILLVAGVAGTLAARAVQAAVQYRRSRFLWLAAAAGGVAGCLPIILPPFVMLILMIIAGDTRIIPEILLGLVWPAAYMVIAVGALTASIRGLRL
jgi:hypothetical protein